MQPLQLLHAVSERRGHSRQLRLLQLRAPVRHTAAARFRYSVFLTAEQRASACIACGTCEELCPQKIAIREWMPKVAALLE
jgi:predicted aldo/keto reductase-like oxidoreductase